ncbi:MAG: CCA tRNA nucleotidyltransferase [Desulfobulbaceae bacterium]
MPAASVSRLLGEELRAVLSEIREQMGDPLYLSGGTVRDLLLGRTPVDIDVTVPFCARRWARKLCGYTGGTCVQLGREEDAARVVWRGRDVDFSSFREGAQTIREELTKRDITINSLAIPLDPLLRSGAAAGQLEVIDPVGGLADLDAARIRMTSPAAFKSDPLRLLRVFRFAAALGFEIEKKTRQLAEKLGALISRPAPERVAYELNLIMETERAWQVMSDLARCGILFHVLPELGEGVGMEQPASHHLDVFDHSMAALHWMVRIQNDVGRYFPAREEEMTRYLSGHRRRLRLRWAALFHDLGKPATAGVNEEKGGRITFYNHDRAGARMVETLGRRLKWSNSDRNAVAALIGMHMRPFFLCNVMRSGELTLKASLRLVRLAGSELPGLFMLAMADSLAGKGAERPEEMEREVAALYERLAAVRDEYVEPVRSGPPLVTGRDLIEELCLEPGPIFRRILETVEEAQMEKKVTTREEAMALARQYIENSGMEQ